LFYIIACLKIYYFSINHNKTRTKSNRTSNSPRCLPVAVLSYVYNQAYLDRHTDSTDSSIIIANKGKFFTVSLSSTSLRRMGNGGLAPQNPQAWHWVVSRDNWFPTFRDTLVDLQSSRLLIRRRRFIFQKKRTFIIFVYKM